MVLVRVPKTVFVGFSGGVDSALTAYLLKEKGFKVVGVYLRQWGVSRQEGCTYEEDVEYAVKTAEHLGIPLEIWDKRAEYKRLVLDYFIESYRRGETPNPDVLCNNLFKFGVFLKEAKEKGADLIATGHYARIGGSEAFSMGVDVKLMTGVDPYKDQSYFLHRLNTAQLHSSVMPIGWLYKSEVRAIASFLRFPNAERKDSQGICFLGKLDVQDFLRRYIEPKKGPIIDVETGKKVGEHWGVWFYTVGQRSGLGIGGVSEPYYVVSKDIRKNILYVAKGRDNRFLCSRCFKIRDLYFINRPVKEAYVGIRYHSQPTKASIYEDEICSKTRRRFWGVAPGQFAVFYSAPVSFKEGEVPQVTSPQELLRDILTERLLKERGSIRNCTVYGGAVINSYGQEV